MGRGVQTEPLVPVGFIRQSFSIRQDGALVHRQSKRTDILGEPAGFEVNGRPVVRVRHNGKTRRIGLLRAAWAISAGAYPAGAVVPRDGNPWNASPRNLEVVPACSHKPQSGAGRASSLVRRQEADAKLIEALAGPDASLAALSRQVGLSEGRVSTKLTRLAAKGLAISPMCVPGRSWALTAAGRGIAAAAVPVLIDDLERRILGALAATSMGIMKLSRRAGTCPLTIRRRLGLLIGRGLVFADPRRFYSLTPAARGALGDASLPPRWVRVEAVSAASAPDVQRRLQFPNEMSAAERTRLSSLNAQKARAAARLNKSLPFNRFPEREQMAG